ncbi:MAG: hypothetical protein ABIG42_03050 [bacterium]
MEVTSQIDEILQSTGYESLTLIIYCMWIAVLVVLIALGLDFWRNFFSMLFFPRVNFGRIAGEQQVLPNLFVALLFGLINGVIGFHYWSNPAIRQSFIVYLNDIVAPLITQIEDMIGTDVFESLTASITSDPNYSMVILGTIPILCLFGWLFYALSVMITGKVLSKGASGGLSSYLSALAQFSWITPFLFAAYWIGFNPGSATAALVLNIIGLVLLAFYMIMTLREYFHVAWHKAIVGVLIVVPIVLAILWGIFIVILLYLMYQINQYI